MATSETGPRQQAAATPASETRIDVAHQAVEAQDAEKAAQYPSAQQSEAAAQQMRTQAAQLAEHLRARQKDLDHREAEINARTAQLESDLRSARLWLNERMAEIQRPGEQPGLEEATCAKSAPRTAEAPAAERQQFEEEEARLSRQYAELRQLQEQLSARQQAAEQQDQARRERLEEEHRRALAELEEQRRIVRRRGEHVDRGRAAMEQLRGELGRLHRETLEFRLATEELWTQLSGAAPPAALVQSLGRIRSKLAEHFRLANAELRGQKEELRKIQHELVEQHQKLVEQKRQFDRWAAARQKEADEQAARLAARERQLERRQSELGSQSDEWRVERLGLEQELRRLRAELAKRDKAMALA
jgi:hypothetical protein